MMFVKSYFRTSDIYLISLVSLDPSGFRLRTNRCHALKRNQYTTCTSLVVVTISAIWTFFFGDVSVAQLVASMSDVVQGGVVEIVGSNRARGKTFTASMGSVDSLYIPPYLSTV